MEINFLLKKFIKKKLLNFLLFDFDFDLNIKNT